MLRRLAETYIAFRVAMGFYRRYVLEIHCPSHDIPLG
jgi:hypothetical protein